MPNFAGGLTIAEKVFVQVAQLDGIGHLAPQEGPQLTAAAVLDWLARAG